MSPWTRTTARKGTLAATGGAVKAPSDWPAWLSQSALHTVVYYEKAKGSIRHGLQMVVELPALHLGRIHDEPKKKDSSHYGSKLVIDEDADYCGHREDAYAATPNDPPASLPDRAPR